MQVPALTTTRDDPHNRRGYPGDEGEAMGDILWRAL
jgi:hypothetical protein